MSNLFDTFSTADFSKDGKYRYKLFRLWDESKPVAMCIGLNPSKADAIKNDATIRNLITIMMKLNYGGFYMMNLFAWITPKPKELLTCPDPIGENENKLTEVAGYCTDVIFCWGTFKQARERAKQIIPRFPNAKCFGKTKDGSPFHPRALTYIKGALDSPQLQNYQS